MAKIQLGVLFGGRACEHDVSIITAVQCMDAVDAAAYDVVPVYIARDGAWYTGPKLRDIAFLRDFRAEDAGVTHVYPDVTSGSGALLAISRKKGLWGGDSLVAVARLDVALLCFHGMNGEDGAAAGLLELMDVPYTASGLVGSSVGMDKIVMRKVFRGHGLPVLEDIWFTRSEWEADADAVLARVEGVLPYPVFVKPANLGSSIGISRADGPDALREAIAVAASYDRRILVERAVEKPVEVNCAVLGFDGDVKPSVLEMPIGWETFLTFDEKYLRGGGKDGAKGSGTKGAGAPGGMETLGRRIPAPIGDAMTARVQAMAVDVFRLLDLKGVVRIDFMIDGDALYIGEINTIPGSLAFYLWEPMGMPYARLIDRMVEGAYQAHAEKNRSVFAFDSSILNQAGLRRKGSKG